MTYAIPSFAIKKYSHISYQQQEVPLLGTKLSLFSLLADMSKKRKEKLTLGEKFRCPKCLCGKNAFILLLRLEKLTKGSLITFLSNRCHGNRYKSNSLIILIFAVRCISSESLN